MLRFSWLTALLGVVIVAAWTTDAKAASPRISDVSKAFLTDHCVACHDGADGAGGLDLSTLQGTLDAPGEMARWIRIFDRVQAGEMPPKDSDRPKPNEIDGFLGETRKWLSTHQRTQWETLGRVRGRRLTNVQLERTLHDLLGIDIPLAKLMTEEPRTNGFTTVADGQPMSHFQIQKHLEVVDVDQNGAIIYSTNEVAAMVRAMSGSAGERFSDPDFQENSFSYLLSSRIVPYQASPTGPFAASSTTLTSTNRVSLSANIASNLFDVQLKFRWPVTKVQTAGSGGMPNIQYRVGKNEMVFRSLVSGSLMRTNGFPFLSVRDPRNDVPLYYFNDQEYTSPAL